MAQKLSVSDIKALLEQQRWTEIRQALTGWPAPELTDLLLELEKIDRVLLFRMLPRPLSSQVFAHLDSEQQTALLKNLTDDETRYLLANLSPDDRTQLFEELPGRATQKLLNLLNAEDLREAQFLLGYPEESVGRLMTPDYVAVRPQWTVSQALDHIRSRGRDSETINVIYITDDNWLLRDALELRRFILADPSWTIEQIMDGIYVCLSAFDDRETAVHMMQRYDLPALPVVDSEGVLVGIVTFDDVMDVAQEEVTEDFHKTAAVTPLKGSYRDIGIVSLYRKRIGWLLALVLINVFSGAAIAVFEDIIAAAVALVFFLPLLIDSSGNAGSQAATLMVRALAMGDVKLQGWAQLLGKEIIVAATLGLTMALAVWGLGIYRGGPVVGAAVALTMGLVVVVGSTIGAALPFLLSRFQLDPATASAPLITSLSDILGVLIYFSIAAWLLGA